MNDAKLTGGDRVLKAGDTMTGALQFSGGANAGVVLSNLPDTQRAALSALPGMIIYNTTLSQFEVYNGAWSALAVGSGTNWFNGSGAPASSLGGNGDYYLDTASGNVSLKTTGAWAVIYSPTIAALPTTGGTMTGALTFANGVAHPIGWATECISRQRFERLAGHLELYTSNGSSQAFTVNETGGQVEF